MRPTSWATWRRHGSTSLRALRLRVLLVRAGALGDLLLLRRVIAGLHGAGHGVSLLAPARPAAALRGPGPGEVSETLPWDGPETAALLSGEKTGGPVGGTLRTADAVVAFSRAEAVLSLLRTRARSLIARNPAPPPGGPHASIWLAQALEPLGVRSPGPPPPLELTPAERREAESVIVRLPTGFLAVHPGSGAVAKNWPVDRFTEAARRLCGDRAWLFVRGPAEEGLPLPSGAIDTGVLPLRTLAAVLARARLFLGNDSGVAHLAAAAGTPTLALFGPTDPALWSPVGPAVATLRAPGRDLARLPVEAVVAAAARLAPTSAASGPPSG